MVKFETKNQKLAFPKILHPATVIVRLSCELDTMYHAKTAQFREERDREPMTISVEMPLGLLSGRIAKFMLD